MTTTLDYEQNNRHTYDNEMSETVSLKQSKMSITRIFIKNRLFVPVENMDNEAIFKQNLF